MVRRPPSPNSETAFESGVRIVQLYGTGNSLRRLSSAEQLTARATTHESMVTERRTAARREIRGECEHEVRTPRQGRFTATVLSTLWTPATQESRGRAGQHAPHLSDRLSNIRSSNCITTGGCALWLNCILPCALSLCKLAAAAGRRPTSDRWLRANSRT